MTTGGKPHGFLLELFRENSAISFAHQFLLLRETLPKSPSIFHGQDHFSGAWSGTGPSPPMVVGCIIAPSVTARRQVVLICVFYMRPGQIALGAARIAELQAEVAEWRERAILPWRRLRVDLRNPGALQETERMALRDKIKALELEAERTEVRMIPASLTRCPPCPTASTDPDASLALLLGSSAAAISSEIMHLQQASLSIS